METGSRKIGVMGGTFDPIHIGHLILGEAACEQFGLDRVYYMPAGNPPHKQHREGRASDEERIEMVRLAISGNPRFELSLLEMNEDGYSYTYRTMETLNEQHPDTEFFFIIGADSLFDFDEWKCPERITAACRVVAATRNQTDPKIFDQLIALRREQFGDRFLKLDTPNLDISSANLRDRIASGQSVKYYIPDPVLSYIQDHHIYAGETGS